MLTFGSAFAGIGLFDLAFEQAGMRCAWQVEKDAACQSVLAHHWPDVPRFGDIRDVGRHNLTAVDLVCGGFPCQDLSLAGNRAGLAGSRSGLWFELHRILRELEPRWVVIENVTGLLSSNEGRDFAVVLGGLTGRIPAVPDGGWQSAGLARGGWYGVAWRVLDARYFGVAQRRRRVFIVASLGDGRAAEVLFESDGSAWDSPPGREATAPIASPLTSGVSATRGVNPPGRRREDDVNLVVARPLSAHHGRLDQDNQTYVVQCHGNNVGPMGALRSGNGGLTGGVPFVARPLAHGATVDHYDESQQTHIVTHPLKAEGADGSEDGTGRGVPIVVNALCSHAPRHGHAMTTQQAAEAGQLLAFEWQNGSVSERTRIVRSGEYAQLTASKVDAILCAGVRRLTPTECERLQGAPDGHTAANGQSDSARYRQLGNAVCRNVAEWLGRRIVAVDKGA